MRATIIPADNFISIDDHMLTVAANLMPAAIDLDGFVTDPKRPIHVIHFDGVVGVIERISRVPGRRDMEHFLGAGPLKAFIEVHTAEVERLATEKAAREKIAEENAATSLKAYEAEAAAQQK